MQAKRKLAALLLSLCMVLGVLPMTAFAAGAPAESFPPHADRGADYAIFAGKFPSPIRIPDAQIPVFL